jgi:hypothetical protein
VLTHLVSLQSSPAGAKTAASKRRARENGSAEANAESHDARTAVPSNLNRLSRLCAACGTAISALKRQGGHKWSGPDVKQMRNSTRLGCAGCNVLICEACWPNFNHVTKCAERDFSGQVTRVLEGQE